MPSNAKHAAITEQLRTIAHRRRRTLAQPPPGTSMTLPSWPDGRKYQPEAHLRRAKQPKSFVAIR